MQRQAIRRKVVEARVPGDKGVMEETIFSLKLGEPQYNIFVGFFNDELKTIEVSAFDKHTNDEVGRLVLRDLKEVNAFMNGVFSQFIQGTAVEKEKQ